MDGCQLMNGIMEGAGLVWNEEEGQPHELEFQHRALATRHP